MRALARVGLAVVLGLVTASGPAADLLAAGAPPRVEARPPAGIVVPATCTGESYRVRWSPPPRRPRLYQLQEATDPGFSTGLRTAYRGARRRARIAGRENGRTYYYRVRALRGAGVRSSWLAGENGCRIDRNAGPPPAIEVPASSNSTTYRVSWGASPTAGVTYELEEATEPGFAPPTRLAYVGGELLADIVGRADGTTYYYRVRASRAGWTPSPWVEGAEGCQVRLTPGDATPPGAVTALAATPGAGLVRLSWVNPADGDFAGVRVRRRADHPPVGPNAGTAVCDVPGESCTDSGLAPGTYHYAAFAYDSSANFSAAATASAVVTTAPDCEGCHDGSVALAPNVIDGPLPNNAALSYNWYGSGSGQDGGHGDAGGRPATACTDCHDLAQPDPGDLHRNGILESVFDNRHRNANTAHLRAEFFARSAPPALPVSPGAWSVQVSIDNYCAHQCHGTAVAPGIADMRHENDTLAGDGNHWSVEFGTHLTAADGDARSVPVDVDLSTDAAGGPDFAPCVSCHDPHGTTVNEPRKSSNRMMRDQWLTPAAILCAYCHL